MERIAVYSITSGLHDESAVKSVSDEFLASVFPSGGYDCMGEDFFSFGEADLNIIYIRTGGAEGIFKELLPGLLDSGTGYFTLLASGKSNSLAASLEILSYLRQNNLKGEVLHGSPQYISSRIALLLKIASARSALYGSEIGIIGHPSDWLIASGFDEGAMLQKLGISMREIPMERLLDAFDAKKKQMLQEKVPDPSLATKSEVRASLPDAIRLYLALKDIVAEDGLSALTVRCFDLLATVNNTGCYALARLNSEGTPSSCEGDVPALLTMMIAKALTGCTGFQANPAQIDVETGEILFAHCTIPFDIVDGYNFDTHFESGIGVGIHGHFPEGPVTVFKVSGDLRRAFVSEGELLRNQYEENLCRTQIWLRIPQEDAGYFLTDPVGNHHIIVPGHHAGLLRAFFETISDN